MAAARRGGRDKVGCIVLGRGEDDKRVHEWLAVAAAVNGFIGFAVGRTDFWEPLVDYRAKERSPEDAVARIAGRYQEFVEIFERGVGPDGRNWSTRTLKLTRVDGDWLEVAYQSAVHRRIRLLTPCGARRRPPRWNSR